MHANELSINQTIFTRVPDKHYHALHTLVYPCVFGRPNGIFIGLHACTKENFSILDFSLSTQLATTSGTYHVVHVSTTHIIEQLLKQSCSISSQFQLAIVNNIDIHACSLQSD